MEEEQISAILTEIVADSDSEMEVDSDSSCDGDDPVDNDDPWRSSSMDDPMVVVVELETCRQAGINLPDPVGKRPVISTESP